MNGPSTGAAMRMKRKEAPQRAARTTSRAASARLMRLRGLLFGAFARRGAGFDLLRRRVYFFLRVAHGVLALLDLLFLHGGRGGCSACGLNAACCQREEKQGSDDRAHALHFLFPFSSLRSC